MRVLKYKLSKFQTTHIDLPESSVVLSVGEQRGDIMAWVLVDESDSNISRFKFVPIMTGEDCDYLEQFRSQNFYGTVFIDWYVFHVFGECPSAARGV